jgi:hypothetical protein
MDIVNTLASLMILNDLKQLVMNLPEEEKKEALGAIDQLKSIVLSGNDE